MKIYFEFYGIKLEVESSDEGLLEHIRRDFSYFLKEEKTVADIRISICFEKPPFEKIPPLKASLHSPDYVCYDDGQIRYVDYQRKALAAYHYKNDEGKIYSEDRELLHELSYLLIHSRVGEFLDKRGIHRIHALGFCYGEKGVLCLLPQGGGKTTLALDLLEKEGVKLLSDDTVLIKADGTLLAFPLRIGILKDFPLDVPSQYLRDFQRRKYGPKTLIDIDYFKDKIAASAASSIILIGKRTDSDGAEIIAINKMKAIGPIVKNAVIGLGLAQMLEYFLRWNIKDIFGKIGILISRLQVSLKVLLSSKTYSFLIGINRPENEESIFAFLKSQKAED